LGCIRFDDGSSKALLSLLEGGCGDVLAGAAINAKYSDKAVSQLDKGCFHAGLSLLGWCISLGNAMALKQVLKTGYDASAPAEETGGGSGLHLAAAVGTNVIIEAVLEDARVRLEAPNDRGFSPLMEAARTGNQRTARRLIVRQASARRGLDGKYWGWMLAFARKQELTEKNLQTGRVGDDDERYYRIKVPGWILLALSSARPTK
jgi:hypothetical protein